MLPSMMADRDCPSIDEFNIHALKHFFYIFIFVVHYCILMIFNILCGGFWDARNTALFTKWRISVRYNNRCVV